MRKLLGIVTILVIIAAGGSLLSCRTKDEALKAGRDAKSMPGADEDYFADMDYGLTKNPEAIRTALDPYIPGITAADAVRAAVIGRNNWIAWTAGNDRLWDVLSVKSVGNLDLLKTISDYKDMKYSRDNRWKYLGLVNEPCFRKGTGPRADRFGLWLDVRVEGPGCGPDPFENEQKYPGVKWGARGKNIPVGSYYGYATGVVGLRLFPNPYFDEAAQKRWDAEKYYQKKDYYDDKNLVKPYRVGMSCGFCHVGPNPSNPPADPEKPTWANLNSNPGAQYFWIDRIFMFDVDPSSFAWQLFHTSRPGALDTSLVSSDQINNPRTMNAIYNLGARLEIGRKWGAEQLAGGSADNKQFNEYVPPGTPLTKVYDPATHMAYTTHVLKDGSDSVGALGALNRVYLNIGLFSEDWLTHFIPLLGGPIITPIRIADAEKNSTYWKANELQTPDVGLFFLATAKPDYLKNAPGGAAYLNEDEQTLHRGKEVFGEYCARCHSSKLPEKAFSTYFQPGCIGPNYLKCWDDYWSYTKTAEFKEQMKQIVMRPDFLDNNFLSNEVRVPSTLLETNACSPLATNAIRGNIWDNFSSESNKNLPAVGKVMIHDPYTGEPSWYDMPAGGRGYTRPASLISLWSTAPYLQNNTVGHFEESGFVNDRMAAFEDGISQMLWPETRKGNGIPGNDKFEFATLSGKKLPGWIDRTTERSYLKVPTGYLPKLLNVFLNDGDELKIGPIPQGTPVNLLSNIDLEKVPQVLALVPHIIHALNDLPAGATDAEATEHFKPLKSELLAVSKCADFIVNKGHYFGTDYLPASEGEPGLSNADKKALIAFLKTF
jgi:hypothetical protein